MKQVTSFAELIRGPPVQGLLARMGGGVRVMTKMPPDETDAEQRHRLWWGVRRAGPVQWLSLCIVLAMVAGLFWLAIHFSTLAGF